MGVGQYATLLGVGIMGGTKTDKYGDNPRRWVVRASSSEGDGHLCRMFGQVADFASYKGRGDWFFQRPAIDPRRGCKILQGSAVSAMAKKIGAMVEFPRGVKFASKSFKKGSMSQIQAAGSSSEQVAQFSGHTKVSNAEVYLAKIRSGQCSAMSAVGSVDIPQYEHGALVSNVGAFHNTRSKPLGARATASRVSYETNMAPTEAVKRLGLDRVVFGAPRGKKRLVLTGQNDLVPLPAAPASGNLFTDKGDRWSNISRPLASHRRALQESFCIPETCDDEEHDGACEPSEKDIGFGVLMATSHYEH